MFILVFILLAEELLKCDWLRRSVFQPNLKYLHVKITVSITTKITTLTTVDFETMAERDDGPRCSLKLFKTFLSLRSENMRSSGPFYLVVRPKNTSVA